MLGRASHCDPGAQASWLQGGGDSGPPEVSGSGASLLDVLHLQSWGVTSQLTSVYFSPQLSGRQRPRADGRQCQPLTT